MFRLSNIIFIALAVVLPGPIYAQTRQEQQITSSGVGIAVFSDEGQQAAFEVSVAKSDPNSTYVIVWQANLPQRWIKSTHQPRTKDGRLVSGFKFAGRVEGNNTKIIVTALVNDRSKQYASTREEELEEQFVETYFAKIGDRVRVSDMSLYGVQPLELRVVSAKSLFPSKSSSTVAKPRTK